MRKILSALYSALFVERKSVIIGRENGDISNWGIIAETDDAYTLRKLDLREPLGSYAEMNVRKDSELILAIF